MRLCKALQSAVVTVALSCMVLTNASGAAKLARYYAHDTVEDRYGVIAPWYTGLNGQCDWRIRIAAETLKRYPWTPAGKAPAEYPEFLWNGNWAISATGDISIPVTRDWDNGDKVQRTIFVITGLVDYYRYTGDPAAIAHIEWASDFLLDYCQTDDSQPWPKFLVSVPVKGAIYGPANPAGYIQLDIAAEAGLAILRAYQVVGDDRWFTAAKHWGDLLAQHCNTSPASDPWGRYANPEQVGWGTRMTGGVSYILYFLDELIRLGYTGSGNSIVTARDAGRAYLRDRLLPRWTQNDIWGRNFWDWECNTQCQYVTNFAARYMMDNKSYFPNWRNDVRNILGIYLNHTSVSPESGSDTYSGAWAYPESFNCCGRSLWYPSMELTKAFAQLGVEADSEWAREIARRSQLLATYDGHETGFSEDNIDGGCIVNGAWFKIAHPSVIKHLLDTVAWLPESLGANRENHIVRSSATISSVIYGRGKISYTTFDAPANTTEVLRLSFAPTSAKANGAALSLRSNLSANGYTLKALGNGDQILAIRHDGAQSVVIEGVDPQQVADDPSLTYVGSWQTSTDANDHGGSSRYAAQSGRSMSWVFTGDQVRLIGRVSADGGKADVYLDGVKQLSGIDCWNPSTRYQQVLCYKNGLSAGQHTLTITTIGTKNPYSVGTRVYVDAVQWSSATGNAGYGEGGGPKDTQRMIFGYTGREDYTDSAGNKWRPGMECITRLGANIDTVPTTWWTQPVACDITATSDPELYRYGVHARDFTVNVTVGPGAYYVRLKFCAASGVDTKTNCVTVFLNGEKVVSKMDVVATAGGIRNAVDLVFNNVSPRNGVIDLRFVGGDADAGVVGEAFLQAVEVGPGDGGQGATPVSISSR